MDGNRYHLGPYLKMLCAGFKSVMRVCKTTKPETSPQRHASGNIMYTSDPDERPASQRQRKQQRNLRSAPDHHRGDPVAGSAPIVRDVLPDELAQMACLTFARLSLNADTPSGGAASPSSSLLPLLPSDTGPSMVSLNCIDGDGRTAAADTHWTRHYIVPDLPDHLSMHDLEYEQQSLGVIANDPVQQLQKTLTAVFATPPAILLRHDVSGSIKAAYILMILLARCDGLSWQMCITNMPFFDMLSSVGLLSFYHGVVRQMYAAAVVLQQVRKLQDTEDVKDDLANLVQQHVAQYVLVKGETPWM